MSFRTEEKLYVRPENLIQFQEFLTNQFGAPFNDFAGSVVVHGMGGWIALAAVLILGARHGRYSKDETRSSFNGEQFSKRCYGGI